MSQSDFRNLFFKILIILAFISACTEKKPTIQTKTIPMGAYSIDLDKDGLNEVIVSYFDEVNETRERLNFFKNKNDSLIKLTKKIPPINHLRNYYEKDSEIIFLDHGIESSTKINGGMKFSYNPPTDTWKKKSDKRLFFFDGDFIKFKKDTFEVVVGLDFVDLKINNKEIPLDDVKGGFISSKFFMTDGGVSLILGPSDTNRISENKVIILNLYYMNKKWNYKKQEIVLKGTQQGVVEIVQHYIDDDEEWDFYLVLHDKGFNNAEIGKIESKNHYLYQTLYPSEFFKDRGLNNYWISQWRWKKVGKEKEFYFRIHPGSSKENAQVCGIGKLSGQYLSISEKCMLGFYDSSPESRTPDFYISNDIEIKKISDLDFSNN